MSTSRGNDTRKRPQKHQNRTAFRNDLHDTSKQTKILNSLEIVGVCPRCKSILEWKIKYKKYKPLTALRKCTCCDQKNIRSAYHVLCSKCAKEKKVCPKCCKGIDVEQDIQPTSAAETKHEDIMTMLQGLPERKRRTVLRNIRKQQNGEEKLTNESKLYIEDILSKMDNVSLDDDNDSLFSDDDDDEDSVRSNDDK